MSSVPASNWFWVSLSLAFVSLVLLAYSTYLWFSVRKMLAQSRATNQETLEYLAESNDLLDRVNRLTEHESDLPTLPELYPNL